MTMPLTIDLAIEELLSLESPSQHTAASVDVMLGGKLIESATVVTVMAAVQPGSRPFPEPDRARSLETKYSPPRLWLGGAFPFASPGTLEGDCLLDVAAASARPVARDRSV